MRISILISKITYKFLYCTVLIRKLSINQCRTFPNSKKHKWPLITLRTSCSEFTISFLGLELCQADPLTHPPPESKLSKSHLIVHGDGAPTRPRSSPGALSRSQTKHLDQDNRRKNQIRLLIKRQTTSLFSKRILRNLHVQKLPKIDPNSNWKGFSVNSSIPFWYYSSRVSAGLENKVRIANFLI